MINRWIFTLFVLSYLWAVLEKQSWLISAFVKFRTTLTYAGKPYLKKPLSACFSVVV